MSDVLVGLAWIEYSQLCIVFCVIGREDTDNACSTVYIPEPGMDPRPANINTFFSPLSRRIFLIITRTGIIKLIHTVETDSVMGILSTRRYHHTIRLPV